MRGLTSARGLSSSSSSIIRPRNSLLAIPRPASRHASTSYRHQSAPRRFLSTTLVLGGSIALVAYYYDSRSLLHEKVIMPIMRLVDPETGHKLAVRLLSGPKWTRPRDRGVDGPELKAELFGQDLVNPIGIAAGFDKDAQGIDGLFDLGFGYVEVGSVTPEPQPGNPQPRFFRLEEDQAAINRYGFNSLGHGQTLGRLRARVYALSKSNPSLFPTPTPSIPLPPTSLPRSLRPGHILAVNLGKNKTSPADSNEDYIKGVRTLGPYADVVVINVSSPNTPGLRALQGRQVLEKLLGEVVEEREKIKDDRGLPKIAVKVACDLSEEELGDVAAAVRHTGVDGVIVSNTTIRRKELLLQSDNKSQTGGLSGKPLFPYALEAVRTIRPLLPPHIPIMGCGGITTGSDAIDMAKAGASIVQIYTSFGYRGVGAPRLLKDGISTALGHTPSPSPHAALSHPLAHPHTSSESMLGGKMWKGVVGSDWAEGSMGWNEDRLKAGSDALKREAEGLGEMLRLLNEQDDIRRLMREAEAALGLGSTSTAVSTPASTLAASATPTPSISTVTAAAAIPQVQGGGDTASRLMESPVAVVEAGAMETDRPVLVLTGGGATGRDGGQRPAFEEAVDRSLERDDPWRDSVQSGDRRLV